MLAWLLACDDGFGDKVDDVGGTGADTNADGDADADADGDADVDADTDSDTDPGTTTDVLGPPDEVLPGTLESGAIVTPLSWANTAFCFASPVEDHFFNGNHVFFEIDKQGMDVHIAVDPEPGLDINFYTLEYGGTVHYPPAAGVGGANRCEAAYARGAGARESLLLQAFLSSTILLGVVGSEGRTDGSFDVRIWREPPEFTAEAPVPTLEVAPVR